MERCRFASMQQGRWIAVLAGVALMCSLGTLRAQSTNPQTSAGEDLSRRLAIDVLVTDATGKPVSGLDAKDFTLLENNQPEKVLGFHAEGKPPSAGDKTEPVQIVIVLDTLNDSVINMGYERQQLLTFLKTDGGRLAHPVTVLLVDEKGARPVAGPSQDGNALAADLDKVGSALRAIRRSEGFWGAEERLQISINTLANLSLEEAKKPGRKLVLWISPGWAIFPRADFESNNKQQEASFNEIVALSTNLRLAQIVLYSLDPIPAPNQNLLRVNLYKDYLKPATEAKNSHIGDLALQVLAEQSGGRVLNSTGKYLWEEIGTCAREAEGEYVLTFDAPPAEHKNEFHSLKVTVNRPGLTARTRVGYYDQP